MEGTLFQINTSQGGVPKRPIAEAELTAFGLAGDKQKDLRYHGGPDRAICLYSLERILQLQKEGHPIFPGSIGENLTISGLEWPDIQLGDRLLIGQQSVIEITTYAAPCRTIVESFADKNSNRISQKIYPGWSRLYAKVITPGHLSAGELVRVVKQ
ncbi:MAG TPA: MOSC domain-containing protein [Blastocatellia bacterium]|nr:MOSC domain-containing protein [Blastocatellia bacterium]